MAKSSRRPRDRTADAPLVVYGANPVRELLAGAHPVTRVQVARDAQLADAARARGVPVDLVDRGTLDRLAPAAHHQGVVAHTPPFRYAPLDVLLAPASPSALVLDGIQDPRNLGAILRTARAAGVGGVVLPQDRSAGITPAVVAASAGLVFGLPVVRVPNLVRAMEALKTAGYWLVGLAADAPESLDRLAPPPRPALVLGGEGEGLRPLVRRTCDFVVSIPMAAGVESLNVSVAAGIALYGVLRPSLTR